MGADAGALTGVGRASGAVRVGMAKTGVDYALQRLFENVADEWDGRAEMMEEGPGWIVLRLSVLGRRRVVAESKISVVANESGIPLVSLEDPDGVNAVVYVSPMASAVIALMLR